jgi:Lon protease-like protein
MSNAISVKGELIPIFPVKGVVFFPRTLIVLHIFEPRYMQLIKDIRENDFNKFALTGFRDNKPSTTGVLVKLIRVESLIKDQNSVIVESIERVQIFDYFRPYSKNDYAIAEVQSFPEFLINADDIEWKKLQRSLYNEFKRNYEHLTKTKFNIHFNQVKMLSPEESVNAACYYAGINQHQKQMLLEINSIYERGLTLYTILINMNKNHN